MEAPLKQWGLRPSQFDRIVKLAVQDKCAVPFLVRYRQQDLGGDVTADTIREVILWHERAVATAERRRVIEQALKSQVCSKLCCGVTTRVVVDTPAVALFPAGKAHRCSQSKT